MDDDGGGEVGAGESEAASLAVAVVRFERGLFVEGLLAAVLALVGMGLAGRWQSGEQAMKKGLCSEEVLVEPNEGSGPCFREAVSIVSTRCLYGSNHIHSLRQRRDSRCPHHLPPLGLCISSACVQALA